jgi:hypothetical protein
LLDLIRCEEEGGREGGGRGREGNIPGGKERKGRRISGKEGKGRKGKIIPRGQEG